MSLPTTLLSGLFLINLLFSTESCKKFIETGPPRTEIASQSVFSSDAGAISAIRGIYSTMVTNYGFINGAMEEYTGTASDELANYSTNLDNLQFYQNALTPLNGSLFKFFWQEPYKYIGNVNAILEGVEASTGMSAAGKKQIEGEAKFIRAFCHFYLAVLYGDIPYVTSSDYKVNSTLSRIPYSEVLSKIETDLLDARNLLPDDFSFSSGERIEPNKGAATALLARIYLYMGNWQKAEAMASDLINNPLYSLETNLNNVFLANSNEAIWQLQPIVPGSNTEQALIFILIGAPNSTSRRVTMTPQMVAAFEPGDQRKSKWVATYSNASGSWNYFYKYKVRLSSVVTEYSMILRLAEQYLIRAEARAQLGNLDGSKADINVIRNRAGLGNTTASDKAELLLAIEQERRVEFCGELGDRWFNLKRTERANVVLAPVKSGWQSKDTLFPIPQSEILLNPNLTQNPGY